MEECQVKNGLITELNDKVPEKVSELNDKVPELQLNATVDKNCPICLDNVSEDKFHYFSYCCHGVCKACNTHFMDEYVRCPICRSPVHEELHFVQDCLTNINNQGNSLLHSINRLKTCSRMLPKDYIINEKSKEISHKMANIVTTMMEMQIIPNGGVNESVPSLNEVDVLAYLGAAAIEQRPTRQEDLENQIASFQHTILRNSAEGLSRQHTNTMQELMANLLENFVGPYR